VNAASELPDDLTGTVGVTAGASAPEWLVDDVLGALAPEGGCEIVTTVEEDEYFPPPPELRDLLRAVSLAAAVVLGVAPDGKSPVAADRTVPAARMLARTATGA
jgi:4-hydroxy-3-methylbut-2-enyl diphosphate reductase